MLASSTFCVTSQGNVTGPTEESKCNHLMPEKWHYEGQGLGPHPRVKAVYLLGAIQGMSLGVLNNGFLYSRLPDYSPDPTNSPYSKKVFLFFRIKEKCFLEFYFPYQYHSCL